MVRSRVETRLAGSPRTRAPSCSSRSPLATRHCVPAKTTEFNRCRRTSAARAPHRVTTLTSSEVNRAGRYWLPFSIVMFTLAVAAASLTLAMTPFKHVETAGPDAPSIDVETLPASFT
jgi:hypothetical protein